MISFPEIYFLKRELKQTDFIVVGTDLLDERDSILLKCILMMCVNLISFNTSQFFKVLYNVNKKEIPSILRCVKKMRKGILFKKRASAGNITHQSFRELQQTAIAHYKFSEKIKYLKPLAITFQFNKMKRARDNKFI